MTNLKTEFYPILFELSTINNIVRIIFNQSLSEVNLQEPQILLTTYILFYS